MAIGCEDGTLVFWSLRDILRSNQNEERLSEEFRTTVKGPLRALLWKEQKFFCCLENGSVIAGSIGSLQDEPRVEDCRAFGACQTNSSIAFSSVVASHTLMIKSEDQQAAVEIGTFLSPIVSFEAFIYIFNCTFVLIITLCQ